MQTRGLYADGKMDVVLPPVVALLQTGVAGWMFSALMRNLRGRSRQDIPRSTCRLAPRRLAPQRVQNTRDPRQLILGGLERQCP